MPTGASRQLEVGLLLLLGDLDAPLDLAHALEIVVHRRAILRAEPALQAGDLLGDRVEHAAILLGAREAIAGVPPWPNIRSNTLRGLISIGIGVVGVRHDSVFM